MPQPQPKHTYHNEEAVFKEIQAYCDKFPTIQDAAIALECSYSHLCMILSQKCGVGIELPQLFGFKRVVLFARTEADALAAEHKARQADQMFSTRRRRKHGPRKT